MPLTEQYTPAALALEHQGIKIYHVYKHNIMENGKRSYLFDVTEDSDENAQTCFDIRDLLTNAKLRASLGSRTQLGTNEDVFEAIRQAIEYRLIDLHDKQEYQQPERAQDIKGPLNVTQRQANIILAALRNYQLDIDNDILVTEIETIATNDVTIRQSSRMRLTSCVRW